MRRPFVEGIAQPLAALASGEEALGAFELPSVQGVGRDGQPYSKAQRVKWHLDWECEGGVGRFDAVAQAQVGDGALHESTVLTPILLRTTARHWGDFGYENDFVATDRSFYGCENDLVERLHSRHSSKCRAWT